MMKDLELGQMLFGNATEKFPVPLESWFDGLFQLLIETIKQKTGDKSFGWQHDFSNDYFTMRSYYWGDEEEMEKPNFEIPSENFRLTWYKYPFRGSYANERITPQMWNDLIQNCLESLK